MARKSTSLVDKAWDLFSSMKLGLALLGAVAVVAGIGTLLPQEAEDPARAEAVGQLWKSLGFTHIYSTFYFRLLLGLLCLNLVVCSVQRFRGIYLKTFKPLVPSGPANVPAKVRQEMDARPGLKQAVLSVLRTKGYRLTVEERGNGWAFAGIKRRWGNWGSFVTHIAFVTLILGALIGSLAGFKGYLMAAVGTTNPIQAVQVQKGSVADNFSIKINSFEPRFLPNGERDNWYTDLSIVKNGAEAARQTISTNHPFTYNGMTFYQSSWGIKITIDFNGQKYPEIMYEGESTGLLQLPGTDLALNLAVGQNLRQPSVLYQVYKGAAQVQNGQIQAGQTVDMQGKCSVTVDGWATGLQVKKDPGVPVIWLGSGLLLLGLALSFYWRPVSIAGVFEPAGDGSGKLTIGLATGKEALEPAQAELAEIIGKIAAANAAEA